MPEEMIKSIEARIQKLENELLEVKENSGGMLSSVDFLQLVIISDLSQAKKDFWKRRFDNYDGRFIIDPFNPQNLTPFSYDVSIGDQVYSCSKRQVNDTKDLPDKTYWMAPKETVVIKTKEFIALPPCYSATIWPRFKMPTESVFQSMVKIDPTWFGELGVTVTNLSAGKYPLHWGRPFATLILYSLKTETSMYLYRKEDLPDPTEQTLPMSVSEEKIIKALQDHSLAKICQVENGKIKLVQPPDAESFKALIDIENSPDWKKLLITCIGALPRQMQGLGLNTLEVIRPTCPNVENLTREDIQNTECNPVDLENAAIEYGTPFNYLSAIPDFIMEGIDREITPRIRAEVEASVFPKTVTLTLTVLGFLTLIIAVVAFLMEKYKPKSLSFVNIDWPTTASIFIVVLGIVVLTSIIILTKRNVPESRAINRLKKKVGNLEKILSDFSRKQYK